MKEQEQAGCCVTGCMASPPLRLLSLSLLTVLVGYTQTQRGTHTG